MATKVKLTFVFYSILVLAVIFILSKQSADFQLTFADVLNEPYRDRVIRLQNLNDSFSEPTFLYRGNLSRHGVDRKSRVALPLTVGWQFENINIGVHTASKSTPAIDGSGIYVGSDSSWFSAFDHTGKSKWRFRVSQANQGIHGTAALDAEFVFFSAYNGRLYKLLKGTGELVWVTQLADAIGSSILLDHEYIYVSCETNRPRNGYLAKLRRDSGELVWKTAWFGEQVHSSPSLNADRSQVFVGANNGKLYAVNSSTGQIEWAFDSLKPIKGTPVSYRDLVAFTSWSGFVYALKQSTGELVWKYQLDTQSQSSPAYLDEKNLLILSASDPEGKAGQILALNSQTGKKKWEIRDSSKLISSALLTQDPHTNRWVAWTACATTMLCALDAQSGQILQKIELGSPLTGVPTAWQDSLYVSVNNGPLLKLSKQKPIN